MQGASLLTLPFRKTGDVVKRPQALVRGVGSAVRKQCTALAGQSERTILLGTVLLATAISAVTGFVLAQYFSIDVLSSLIFVPDDCPPDMGMHVGRHCFSDYGVPAAVGMLPNPWDAHSPAVPGHASHLLSLSNYSAAGMLPQLSFGLLGAWLHAPLLGLFSYLLVLTVAVLSPAGWAASGACGLERIVVFFACGVVAIPVWMVIDRCNSAGLVVPIALLFLVALCRRRWKIVTIAVILAALVKPQFAILAVALFAARQWRFGGIALVGVLLSNIAAYLVWPQDFPETIAQSIRNALGYGSFKAALTALNASFGRALLLIPDNIEAAANGGKVPDGFLAGPRLMIGYIVLVLVVVAILALGRRIPPVMVGITLLPTASLFVAVNVPYYLVFALPIAALVVRDPDGPPGTGIFDRPALVGGRRRAVGICVSLAAAFTLAHIAIPSPPVHVERAGVIEEVGGFVIPDRWVVVTTMLYTPLLWLGACAVVIASYARRPAQEQLPDAAVSNSSKSEPETEAAPRPPA